MTQVRTRGDLAVQITSPATTWALLAALLSVDELIEVGDAIVYVPRRGGMRRGTAQDALAQVWQLASAAEAGRRVGIDKLRTALAEIRTGAASPGETKIRLACARNGLPEPELDVDVFHRDGRPIGFTELAFRKYAVLVEYEGDQHRLDRFQWNRDIDKYDACREAGWEVVRLTAKHTTDGCREAVNRIRKALMRGGWKPEAA